MRFSQIKSVATLAVTSAVLAMSSTAFAANTGVLTNDQVRAEYLAARVAGTLVPHGDAPTAIVNASPSTLTRDAVIADYLAARAAGTQVPAGDAQAAHSGMVPGTLSRDAVRAEFAAARAAGTLTLAGERG